MSNALDGKLVVAISSRALFDFEEENRVFDQGDDRAYMDFQLSRSDVPARPGVAFPLIKKLLAFNTQDIQRVEVTILSRNDPVSGLRVYASAKHHGLSIERGIFTRGRPTHQYLSPLQANLFLSSNELDVRSALASNVPAALVYQSPSLVSDDRDPGEIRIAFDGDSVLFSDEAESIYTKEDLAAFVAHEVAHANTPLPPGPFKPFLTALHQLQTAGGVPVRLRTALVTARSAPAHERAIRTLMNWNIEVDEAFFLGGLPKGPFLQAFAPDFFFDDQAGHCASASKLVPSGQVVYGVKNQHAA